MTPGVALRSIYEFAEKFRGCLWYLKKEADGSQLVLPNSIASELALQLKDWRPLLVSVCNLVGSKFFGRTGTFKWIMASLSIMTMASFSAWAQGAGSILATPNTTTLCFEVVPMTRDAAPSSPILINRCTGATWFLAQESVTDARGNSTGKFVLRWHPLGSAGNEAILGSSGLPGTPSPQAN
jgi:hypothetical protein